MTRKNWSKVLLTVIILGCFYSCSQFSQQTPTATIPASTSTLTPMVASVTPSPDSTKRAFAQTATVRYPTVVAEREQAATAYMATRDALSAYVTYVQTDKNDWVIYNPRENSGPLPGSSITIAPNGDIWMVGRGNVSKFNGSDWVTYLIPDGKESNDASYTTTALAIGQDNSVWVGGNNYPLYRFDGTTWYIELEDVSVVDIEINPIDGAVWIADKEVGIRKYDGTNWTIHPNVTEMNANTLDIAIDKNGIIWVISLSGISSYDGQVWTNYPEELFCAETACDQPKLFPNRIIADSDGSVWFAIYGVALFHYIDGTWERYENQTIFMTAFESPVVNLCLSPDGMLWLGKVGMHGLSLSYFDGEDIYVPYISSDIGEKSAGIFTVSDIACADDGSIWMVSAYMGVVHYTP